MTDDLSQWTPRPLPEHKTIDGRYVRLEPLDPKQHSDELYAASAIENADEKFLYLYEEAPTSKDSFNAWVKQVAPSKDPLYYAVIDKASGKVAGRQTFMRMDPANGSIEIGHIYWGPLISRKPTATEALYLFMQHAFADLGYRRFEWKCNNKNEPSKSAALRFGFQQEGLFRQHLVTKGANRDTAWFSIIDKEWPTLHTAYEAWLAADNFDAQGQQKQRLSDLIAHAQNAPLVC